jgi:hypothetical protein
MNDLLKLSLEAHGWLERWRRLTVARASAYIIGNSGASKASRVCSRISRLKVRSPRVILVRRSSAHE